MMRRVAVILVVIAGASVIVWWLVRSGGQAPPNYVGQAPLDQASWASHSDARLGWSLRYPSRWHLQLVEAEESPDCQGDAVVVTNFDGDLRHPDLGPGSCTGVWDMRDLRSNFVVVEIEVPVDVPPGPEVSQRTTPLSLKQALEGSRTARFGVPKGVYIPAYFGQRQYFIRVWHGPDASPQDLEIAHAIVTSMRFDVSP